MATRSKKRNSQARGQKRKRKQDKRQRQKARNAAKSSPITIGRKHQQQIDRLTPKAWQAENELDVAVFDENAFDKLSHDQQQQVDAIKTALDLIAHSRWEDAENSVAAIPRQSPAREWRMLIRGLKHWFASDLEAAGKSWSRLDSSRRPARIAYALELAHRDDLAELELANKKLSKKPDSFNAKTASLQNSTDGENVVDAQSNELLARMSEVRIDRSLLLAAKVVRRMRIQRSAINLAMAGVSEKLEFEDEIDNCTITPEKIKWLKEFTRDFRRSEPELVRSLQLAALERASHQSYVDVFEMATESFRGPAHDRSNYLRSFLFFVASKETESKANDYLQKYLEKDLPFNEEISELLRNAMLSVAWLKEAESEVSLANSPFVDFGFFGSERGMASSKKTIRKYFTRSIKSYPANRDAHDRFTDWLVDEIDDRDTSKKEREKLGDELVDAMKSWAKVLPDDVEPRLFLAETLLENEKLEEAVPHVQWLVTTRPEDPRLKALPWKLKLLEAMQLCRRKTNLPQVSGALEEVKRQWPSWLSARWLPYFNAAWLLRCGDVDGYEKQRMSICSDSGVARDSLVDACMMLGAAQKMKVVAADLKPLRVPVDTAVKSVKSLSDEELIAAGSFFWDMVKVKILYPAFRMHGSKFGRELLKRIKAKPGLVSRSINDPQFIDTMLWCSEYRFWGDGYESKIPASLKAFILKHPHVAAAYLNGVIKQRWVGRGNSILETAEFLRASARSEPDPFYRYWFTELADNAEDIDRESNERLGLNGMFGNRFGNAFGFDEDDEDDSECDCPECRATRERQSRREARQETLF